MSRDRNDIVNEEDGFIIEKNDENVVLDDETSINNAKAKLKDINEYINSNIKTGLEATETSIALYDLIKAKETAIELNKKDMNLLFDYFRVENNFFVKSVLTQEEFKSIITDYNDKKIDNLYKAVQNKIDDYCKRVPEEDRFKAEPYDKIYSRVNIMSRPKSIVESCNNHINELPKGKDAKINSVETLKEKIANYKYLKQCQDTKPWYKKFWAAITGKREEKALNNYKESIINSTDFPKKLMEKALNVDNERHLNLILQTAENKYREQVYSNELPTVESVEIKELDEQYIAQKEAERLKKAAEKEAQDRKELDEVIIENPGVVQQEIKEEEEGIEFEVVNSK